MNLHTKLRLCRAAQGLCRAAMAGGLAWLLSSGWAVTQAASYTPAWLFWQGAQMLFALGLIFSANKLDLELEFARQELESRAYKQALYHGLLPDGRHSA